MSLDSKLGLGTAAAGVGRVGMTAELELLRSGQLQDVLEAFSDAFKALAVLQRVTRLVLAALGWLACGSSPETNTPEGLANVDNHAHDLVVALILEHLADGSEHDVQPGLVVRLAALKGVCPTSTVLVLLILPLGTYALLEEMVV